MLWPFQIVYWAWEDYILTPIVNFWSNISTGTTAWYNEMDAGERVGLLWWMIILALFTFTFINIASMTLMAVFAIWVSDGQREFMDDIKRLMPWLSDYINGMAIWGWNFWHWLEAFDLIDDSMF